MAKLRHLNADIDKVNNMVHIASFMLAAMKAGNAKSGDELYAHESDMISHLQKLGWKETEIELIIAKLKTKPGAENEQTKQKNPNKKQPE